MYKIFVLLLIFQSLIVACVSEQPSDLQLSTSKPIESKYMSGAKLVIISHPSCGYSQKAFRDFSPKVREYLRKNAIFIAPISEKHVDSELNAVAKWNKTSEFYHWGVLRNSELAFLNLDSTPQFYFFRDGKVVELIVGWPKNKSNLRILEKAVRKNLSNPD